MFCPNCGNRINDNSSFCNNCGYKIKKQNKQNKSILNTIIKKQVAIVAIVILFIIVILVFTKRKNTKNYDYIKKYPNYNEIHLEQPKERNSWYKINEK